MRLEIVRRTHGVVVLDNAYDLAVDVFTRDRSSAEPDSYDELARAGEEDHYTLQEAATIKSGMRLPWSPDALWEWLVNEAPIEAFGPLPRELDLIDISCEEWAEVRPLVGELLAAFVAPQPGEYRAVATVSKMLHLKRPRLIPICDRYVQAMVGVRVPDSASQTRQVEVGLEFCDVMRREGRRNRDVLGEIRRRLIEEHGKTRTLVRVEDAILWKAF